MEWLGWDNSLTFALYRWGSTTPLLQAFFLVLASLFIYLLPLILLWLFFRSHADRMKSVKIFLAALLAWQVLSGSVGAYLYSAFGFRDRPFALDGVRELFFERPEKAFPSDHAAVMLAVALAFFGYRYPKLGYLFLIGGFLSSFGRVTVGFHYVGDILAGWALGAVAYFIIRALDRYLDPIIARLTSWVPFWKARADGA
jgi:undecaprenyl-diphosphatase